MRTSAVCLAAVLLATASLVSAAPSRRTNNDALPRELAVPGHAKAYYFPPKTTSKRVILWLHGRGAHVADDCVKWAPVARKYGWLLCPQGDEDRGGGARGWANNAEQGRDNVEKALGALRRKHKNTIEPGRHVMIGFSEGAFIAMQLGVHETATWSRWLILAANDGYWLGDGVARLHDQKKQLRRAVLLTGASDEVVQETRRTYAYLEREHVAAKLIVPSDLGHDVPAQRMSELYTHPLRWLLGLENDPPPKTSKRPRAATR
jgi:predicted esterase